MNNIFSELLDILKAKGLTLATADSLSGGLLSSSIVDIPGASQCFKEGFITYCDEAKLHSLGVSAETIKNYGAVSGACAKEMAIGAAKASSCSVSISTTGNAGPACSEGKEAGLVYIGIYANKNIYSYEFLFKGDRADVRRQSVDAAVRQCIRILNEM